jgi:hypothetical protein
VRTWPRLGSLAATFSARDDRHTLTGRFERQHCSTDGLLSRF